MYHGDSDGYTEMALEELFDPDHREESYYDSYNQTQQYYEEELYPEPERSASLYVEPAYRELQRQRFPPRQCNPKVPLERMSTL